MTENQIRYLAHQENVRHNLTAEGQTDRNLREAERSNRAREEETNRSNLVKEGETHRANRAKERLDRDALEIREDEQELKEQNSSVQNTATTVGTLMDIIQGLSGAYVNATRGTNEALKPKVVDTLLRMYGK